MNYTVMLTGEQVVRLGRILGRATVDEAGDINNVVQEAINRGNAEASARGREHIANEVREAIKAETAPVKSKSRQAKE